MYIPRILKKWVKEENGLAAVEAALIFPIMLVLMLGVVDLGNAILANQKAVRASQVVADLIARNNTVTQAEVNEAIEAGRLAFEPLNSTSYGVDIVSIRFDEDAEGEIVWRDTVNMSPVSDPLGSVDALATENEGVVMVSVQYVFDPVFANFTISGFTMREVGFSRGRSTPVINKI